MFGQWDLWTNPLPFGMSTCIPCEKIRKSAFPSRETPRHIPHRTVVVVVLGEPLAP